jgi:DNA polymerase-1
MEKQGVYVDSEMLETLSSNLSVEIDMITNQIFSISGYEFNINSPQQLAVLIFDELKLKEIKKRSTAMEVLKVLRNYHPIADLVLKYRHLNKLKNTYLDAFPKYINKKTNRIHSSFHQATTITGRLSSSNPNFQNIPIRTDYGKEIRKAFCSDNGNKIISADYSQVELRIMAEFSKEPNLIDAFNNDIDIHTRTAALINNISENNVDDNQRRTAKVVNFGIMYGAGPFRMSQELGISIKESKDLIETYFCTYPRIKEYMDNTIAFANKYGYVKTLLGRKKNINLGSHLSVQMQKAEERALINMPIQGTAAELIKVAMINIFHKFKNNNLNTKMILQIHDELIFESSINEQEIAKKIIVSEMEEAMSLSIPLKVSCNTGDNWYEAH